jgi:hypothetical protein
VRNTPNVIASTFRLHSIPKIENVGINLYEDNVLYNFVIMDSILMNGTILWRGSRKKDPLFLQMLITASIEVSDIVVDCFVTIGELRPLSFLFFQSIPLCNSIGLTVIFMKFCRGFCSCLPESKLPHCSNEEREGYFQDPIAVAKHRECQQGIQEEATK